VAARRRIAEDTLNKALMEVPTTVEELLKTLGRVFVDVRARKIDAATARVMANVGQVIMKGFELIDANNRKDPAKHTEQGTDPADLTTEEWEQKYGRELGAAYAVNPHSETPESRLPAIAMLPVQSKKPEGRPIPERSNAQSEPAGDEHQSTAHGDLIYRRPRRGG
jgi:hypothetical protein